MALFWDIFCNEKEKELKDLSLEELEHEIFEITENQNQLSHLGLSDEVYSFAYEDLECQKKDLKLAMHTIVEKL